METMRAAQVPIPDPTPPPPPQPNGPLSRQEIMLRNFVRSPLSAHKEINPDKPMLDYDGVHFQLWHDAHALFHEAGVVPRKCEEL
jgi:hypothetical protein